MQMTSQLSLMGKKVHRTDYSRVKLSMFVWKQSGCMVVYYVSNMTMVVNDMFVSDCMKFSVQYHLIAIFTIFTLNLVVMTSQNLIRDY